MLTQKELCEEKFQQLLDNVKDYLTSKELTKELTSIEHDIDANLDFVKDIKKAIYFSELTFKTLNRYPETFIDWKNSPPSFSKIINYQQELNTILLKTTDKIDFFKQLRIFRNKQLSYLSFLQSLNLATVEQIFIKLSELADALILQSYDYLYNQLVERFGYPCNQKGVKQPLLILAMGKLGGKELNFSSDIDLILTYPESGNTNNLNRSITNEEFFIKLTRNLVDSLVTITEDGFVYRIDLRLRPFGDDGPLVINFSSIEDYYQTQGRDWERYAMIKARVINADINSTYTIQLQKLLQPFTYRRYIDFSVLQALREMKAMIIRELRQQQLTDNIKLGIGGIREIEFINQVLQLIYGGQKKDLQTNSILETFKILTSYNYLSTEDINQLRDSYLFLRRIENILQAINDQQTQILPTNIIEQQLLIDSIKKYTIFDIQHNQKIKIIEYKINTWNQFIEVLNKHKQAVHKIFQELIGENEDLVEHDISVSDNWLDFLDHEFDQSKIEQDLTNLYKLDQEKIIQIIETLRVFHYEINHKVIGHRGKIILNKLINLILEQLLTNQQVNILLPRVLNLIVTISSRTAYLEFLFENKNILNKIYNFFVKSAMISEQVAKYPILLDDLLSYDNSYQIKTTKQYKQKLNQELLKIPADDEEQIINKLRQFKQINLFNVAIADISKTLDVMKVSDQLTFLAEAIISNVVDIAWDLISLKYGKPKGTSKQNKNFMIIGYGKLGGIELGYKSDLDLVFIYDGYEQATTDHPTKNISLQQFYLRLTQKIITIFTTNSTNGILYQIDTQLRPSGNSGLLVSSIDAFINYQQEQAWTWEKQALVRARAIYGNTQLIEKFDQLRANVLTNIDDVNQLATDVVNMRNKMLQNKPTTEDELFDIKKDPGGIVDIEFIAQYLVLANSKQYPGLTRWSDNVRIFESLAKDKIISANDAEVLIHIYTRLRNKIHHLNLDNKSMLVKKSSFNKEINYIKDFWQKIFNIS